MTRAMIVAIVLGLVVPARVHAEAPADARSPASLPAYVELGVASTVMEVELVRSWTSEAIVAGLQDAGVVDVAQGRVLVVDVGGAPFDYALRLGVRAGADWVGELRTFRCTCDDSQLVDRVRTDVAALGSRLRPVEVLVEPAPLRSSAPRIEERRAGWGALGKAGLGVALVGVATTTAGVPFAVHDGEYTRTRDDVQRERRRWTRPAGLGVVAAGGALLVAGVTMLVVDRVRAKSRRLAVLPAVGDSTWVLVMGGRF